MKFILHIGAGKTGTSSIQRSLLNSNNSLSGHGVKYLGMMLENSPIQSYKWQTVHGYQKLLSLRHQEAQRQVGDILQKTLEHYESSNIHTLIWSHEIFFDHPQAALSPTLALLKDGHDVKVVAYVRCHAPWAKSAYIQWGIKHKRNKGELLSFSDYIKRQPVEFYNSLAPWEASFGDKFVLRNFDSKTNVVDDFFEICGININLVKSIRINDSPGPEELVLRAIFNDKRPQSVQPWMFNQLFMLRNINFRRNPVDWVNELLPSYEDLNAVRVASKDDLEAVNKLLKVRGEPGLSFEAEDVPAQKALSINHNTAYSILFEMIESQALQLERHQNELNELKNSRVFKILRQLSKLMG